MRVILVAVLAAVVMAGCGSEGEAKDAVKKLLNDPDSAQFSDLEEGRYAGDVCGSVNAKNRMGGYVGATPFFFQKATKMVAIVKPPEDSDFRMLYLSIGREKSTEEFSKVTYQCSLMAQWGTVCKKPHPLPTHSLCQDILDSGHGLYDKLRKAYER